MHNFLNFCCIVVGVVVGGGFFVWAFVGVVKDVRYHVADLFGKR